MADPTVGTVGGEVTASGAVTIDATTRAIWIVMYGGSNTTFTHGTQTASLGGLSATLHQTNLQTQVHVCGYYIEDIAARSNDTLTLGGTIGYGTGVNQYRVRVICINHPTNKVLLSAENGANANANGGTIVCNLAPGVGVTSLALVTLNTQSTIVSGQTGLTSSTNRFSNVGGPAGTTHRKWMDSGTITGSTNVGYSIGGGSNTQRALLATAWKEGAALTTPSKGRVWALGMLPEIALPLLGHGLVAARVVPWAS